MKINNENLKIPNKSIKQIYKEFGLRDVREARKILGLNKNTKRDIVNKELRDAYNYIWEEKMDDEEFVYLYTLEGESRREYKVNGETKLSAPSPIDMTFQSKTKYDFKKVNIVGITELTITNKILNNNYPIVYYNDNESIFEKNTSNIISDWMNKGDGQNTYKVNTIIKVSRRKIPITRKSLKNVPLYNATINLPYKEFNGFRDSGNMMCVPETILYHLQLNGRNKKLKLEDVIKSLDDNDDEWIFYNELEEGEIEPFEECGKGGYDSTDIVRVLEKFNCRCRLLDIHCKEFLTSNYSSKFDKHLNVFVGIVYNNHLYYCNNKHFVKCLSEKLKEEKRDHHSQFTLTEKLYEKKKSEKADKYEYHIIETNDLTDYYRNEFKKDNTIRHINTENGRITSIIYDDKKVCANPEKTIMIEMLGNNFKNENTTILGNLEFKEYFPNHKKSHFTKDVYEKLSKHGNYIETLVKPKFKYQHEYDYNKCRTDCWMNNRLGDYEMFGVECQIELYSGIIRKGIYYVEPISDRDRRFFVMGCSWYSGDYIKIAKEKNINFRIKYQLLASNTIKHDYYKNFCEYLITKYPNHFKKIINSCIGCRGKTQKKIKKGYIETDFELAVSAFWDNNDEKIGFLYDENIEKKLWKTMRGKLCNIQTINIDEDTKHYIVEFTDVRTLYENDMPIYNKILENEFLRIYELQEALGGRIIKIKTDAVIVEGKHNHIELSDGIGGIKYRKVVVDKVNISNKICDYSFDIDTALNWNVIEEKEDWTVDIPNGSFLITGLAGFGKSVFAKSLPEYNLITTIRLGFTNVSCDNLSSEEHDAYTLNSYFGIDFNTGKGSEKKLNNLKHIKCIMLTEAFMTPSMHMGYLKMIKDKFPEIKFICEGDPEQIRPVGEEHINWLNREIFFNICDGNMVKLLYNKRNNETKNYHKILNGIRLEESYYSNRPPRRVNICKTNNMRLTINHIMMKPDGYFIAKNKSNPYSQDIWLTLDTPIMCIKSNKKMTLKNGKTGAITSITKNKIVVDGIEFSDECFAEHFVVAYAMTNHKVQSITIREPFNIYEFYKMSKREQYTAYSRTRNAEYVKIIENEQFLINSKLCKELSNFFKLNYCVYKWECKDCNHIYIGHTNNYNKRRKEHQTACNDVKNKSYNNNLYKYMRKFGGYDNWEMSILEEFYAPDRKDAEIIEQSYIDKLKPSLNMVAAVSKLNQ